MFISVTYLELKSITKIFRFIKYNFRVVKQMKNTPGLLKQETRGRSLYRYYTLTAWNSKQSMLNFRNSEAHLEAMRITKSVATKADAINFESDDLPGWKLAFQMMDAHLAARRK